MTLTRQGTKGGRQSYSSMARQPRVHFPGAIYHAMARGVDGRDIFIDDFDRNAFLATMRRIEQETSARVIAYCLMGNHFHLAIQVSLVTLSAVMQRLQTSYCMRFNWRHDRTGHLFQARHKAIVCGDDRYLTGLIRYIHMNPVRAKLVASPGDWPWSSYVPGEIVGSEIVDFNPWPKDRKSADAARPRMEVGPVDLEAVGSAVVERTGVSLELLRSEHRDESILAARRLFVKDAVHGGCTLVSAAKWLNISSRSASRYIQERNVMVSGLTPI